MKLSGLVMQVLLVIFAGLLVMKRFWDSYYMRESCISTEMMRNHEHLQAK